MGWYPNEMLGKYRWIGKVSAESFRLRRPFSSEGGDPTLYPLGDRIIVVGQISTTSDQSIVLLGAVMRWTFTVGLLPLAYFLYLGFKFALIGDSIGARLGSLVLTGLVIGLTIYFCKLLRSAAKREFDVIARIIKAEGDF